MRLLPVFDIIESFLRQKIHDLIKYVTLIDGLAYITDFRKRHPTRASNRLAILRCLQS